LKPVSRYDDTASYDTRDYLQRCISTKLVQTLPGIAFD
jgi:hypothetical protein